MPSQDKLWKAALLRPVLGSRGKKIFNQFLLDEMPRFVAPTNAATWPAQARKLRRQAIDRVFLRGWPKAIATGKPRVVWGQSLQVDPSYRIRKLRYEICPDYWIPALLYEPTALDTQKVPVILNPNGHHHGGKAIDYKQARCANIARRGMLALSFEFIGMGELEADLIHDNLAHLDLMGVAGVGLMYMAMSKGLDVLLAHKNADAKRVGVTGLSGGGWQTITISALDERVTLTVPVAGYTAVRSRVGCEADMGDLEQCPVDLTTVADYQTMTAMLAPRPALLITNLKDECCFRTDRAKPVIYDPVRPTYQAFGALEKFEHYANRSPGVHNYDADNRAQFYRFVNRHFGLDTPAHDIHNDQEILPEADLQVGLPPNQATVLSLALRFETQNAPKRQTPRTPSQRAALRRRVAEVIHLPKYQARLIKAHGRLPSAGLGCGTYELGMGPWRVPVTSRVPARGAEAELTISLRGRADLLHRLPPPNATSPDRSAFAADILGIGENAVTATELIMVGCCGHRPLGIQVAQTLATLRWIARETGQRRVHLRGWEFTGALVALLAAALEPDLVASLILGGGLTSLASLARRAQNYSDTPTLFCFGLLEVVDIPQLHALLEGITLYQLTRCVRPIVGPNPRPA